MQNKPTFVQAIFKEIVLQKDYLGQAKIDTLYFGGGTPSLLDAKELTAIITQLRSTFDFSHNAELTLEANPDDLSIEKLQELKAAGINRLSIGIQTFSDDLLKFYNRAHNSQMALESVKKAQQLGFDNISIDLIFGAPNQSIDDLHSDLQKALELGTPHISIYGLTIEEKTAFGKWYDTGKLKPLDEELAAQHFELIMETLKVAGYEQYEISNFGKPGFKSRHNSAYWQGKPYLGLGPAAHSYNGDARQYNIANNAAYIRTIEEDELPCEIEILSPVDKINETILIQMRLAEGLDLQQLKNTHHHDLEKAKPTEIASLIQANKVLIKDNFLRFTDSGKLLADFIIEKLII